MSSNSQKSSRSINRAFTLIEMLIVVAIIGMLISLITVQIRIIRAKSRDVRRVVDNSTIGKALALYNNNHEKYPNYPDGLVVDGTDELSRKLMNDGILNLVPADPISSDLGAPAECIHNFHYYYEGNEESYVLSYCLEINSHSGQRGYYETGP